MAGINTPAILTESGLAREQFRTIAWLRWRIFINSLRGKGATGELVVKILSYPILALMVFGPAIGAGLGSWYLVSTGMYSDLAILLWIIFALWQFIGVSTSATGPSFDLSTLIRYPIRYRDYLLIRLSFGLLDPPTLAGITCLIAMTIGIAVAAPILAPWSALVLFFYAICNIFFSRMVYSWIERWLAQRRTREILTVLILLASLGIQVVVQFAQRLDGHHGHPSPLLLQIGHALIAINWCLPPGLASLAIERMHGGLPLIAIATLLAVGLYVATFLFILHIRLHAEYLGENLSEVPASAKVAVTPRKESPSRARDHADTPRRRGLLPDAVSACIVKELRYLMRSGAQLYSLVVPPFMVFIFTARTSAMGQIGMHRNSVSTYLFTYGCAYTLLVFVSFIYNCLGSDAAGVQFYFIAPVRMRNVILAKNILTGCLLAIEILLIYISASLANKPPSLEITVATVAWMFFAIFLNMIIGNMRSITAPKVLQAGKVRRQNVSGLSSLISFGVMIGAFALGVGAWLLCSYFGIGYWGVAAIFFALGALAFGGYLLGLQSVDSFAAQHHEHLTSELTKGA
ncbi:hypothetical protein [Acidicapsa ligni]|uniref:hypothetical protein n=1 Tax=Acidicapsa ligni TaxID=542300 RepID=UPI0021E0BAF0|nr:hypothetical protein [Acidicapsa ligni]